MAKVFLSYDRDDTERARPVAIALEKAGHYVWWDLHIRGGEQFSKVIDEALQAADAVVVLWSKHSIESPWVRDEAAAGRDSGRLIPVSLDDTKPPLGFRQYQTIDLSSWKGRGKPAQLLSLFADVEAMARSAASASDSSNDQTPLARPAAKARPWRVIAAIAFALSLAAAAAWRLWPVSSMPVVEVAATDPSPRSAAAASDLFVKLGKLAQVGQGKWQLIDSTGKAGNPDLVFRIADTGSEAQPQSNLVLLNGDNNSLLWSREFNFPAGRQADLRQLQSLTAGRVLGCALEARQQGDLPPDLLKSFLDACASLADLSGDDYGPVIAQLRKIVDREPGFRPGWARLIMAESTALSFAWHTDAAAPLTKQLKADSDRARSLFPDLPELAIVNLRLRGRIDYKRDIEELSAAVERAPENSQLSAELSNAFLNVGRMQDAVANARRAAELDPLSAGGTTTYIMTLAHGGQIETARNELAKVENLWAGTGSLRDVQLAFHLRYGDPAIARKIQREGYNSASYYEARTNPSPANIARLKSGIDEFRAKAVDSAQVGWAIQGLGQFGLTDDVYYWLGRLPTDQIADISYILFRPALAPARRDGRFMPLAKRIGLVDYWRSSGHWPDFCSEPDLPYDCKKEAAKLTA